MTNGLVFQSTLLAIAACVIYVVTRGTLCNMRKVQYTHASLLMFLNLVFIVIKHIVQDTHIYLMYIQTQNKAIFSEQGKTESFQSMWITIILF